jgi:uncharacterized protein YnzC (UPF0291/DUF896 family)
MRPSRLVAVLLLSAVLCLASVEGAGPPVRRISPNDEVVAAAADILRVPADDKPFQRYLTTYAVPDEDRERLWSPVIAFHLNSLSTRPNLEKPHRVTSTLWRLDVRDYGWKVEVHDRLGDVDPHFRETVLVEKKVKVQKWWKGGVWPADGKSYNAGWYTETKRKQVKEVRFASHLDGKAITLLAGLTQSKAPILRVDWFFGQTAIQQNRVAGYYDFLNVKNRNDFDKLVSFDKKLSDAGFKRVSTIVEDSGVAQNNRQIDLEGAAGAWYSRTKDVLNKQTAENNATNQLDKDFVHDAERIIAPLPNGMLGYHLNDKNGVQQKTAPQGVGPDKTSTSNDPDIHPYLSCVRCHKVGLHSIPDKARIIWSKPGELTAATKEDQERLAGLYLRDYEKKRLAVNLGYSEAVVELLGEDFTPRKIARRVREAWKWAVDDRVDIEQAARELGVSKERLVGSLRRYALPANRGGLGQVIANSLIGYTRDPPLPMLR